MVFNEEHSYKLKKFIKELDKIRGRHTELVSIYVPSGFNIQDTIGMLKQEHTLASNVKDKTVRKNVMSALEKVVQHLKIFKQTPPNGLIAFCGNVSDKPGASDIKLWSIEPPEKLATKVYRCDQIFILEPLKEMVKEREVYGLIVVDAKEATIGLLKGKAIESLKHIESTVPSKTVKGGMSQGRYDRIREDAVHDFLKEVGEKASEIFLKEENLIGLIIGGPGPIKDRFAKEEYLNYQIKKKMLGVKDVSYTDEYGLEELAKRSTDLMEKAAVVKEREIIEKFFSELQKGGNVVYGFEEVNKALEQGAVETLLLSEEFDWVHVKLKCQCGFKTEKDLPKDKTERQLCGNCQKPLEVEETKELIDVLAEKAKSLGTNVEFISTDTREGAQFKELGGIGGFLRYRLS